MHCAFRRRLVLFVPRSVVSGRFRSNHERIDYGSVRDASGGVIPGATVTLVSATRGTTIETTTNENGDFTFPNAPGDTYTVRVTMDGFKTVERTNVPLTPGERVVVPALTIEVGALNETITVTGDAPMIQSSMASDRSR